MFEGDGECASEYESSDLPSEAGEDEWDVEPRLDENMLLASSWNELSLSEVPSNMRVGRGE